jgi:long-chain acyl-CoA synthetase
MNLFHAFGNAAIAWPDAPAVFAGRAQQATFRELGERALRLSAGLRSAGLNRGDRVAVVMSNCVEYVDAMLAIWAAGCVLVPVNAKLHEREFAYVLEHSKAKICFTDAEHLDAISRAVARTGHPCRIVPVPSDAFAALQRHEPASVVEVDPTAPGWIFYTSGTTGRSKGALLSHRNLWLMTLSFMTDCGPIDTTTRTLMAAPMSHASGLLLMAYLGRGAAAVVPDSHGFDPAEVIDLINAHGNTQVFTAPTMLKRIVESPRIGKLQVDRLDTMIYGGGPMYVADTLKALDVLGPRLWQIYGQGETPCTITYLSKQAHADKTHERYLERLASVGVTRTGVLMRVVDSDGRPVPPGEIGEIIVKGDTVMTGYLDNPEATRDAIRDGWLYTGDLGTLDQDGYLTLKDRSKDLIISGGSNIYPREIEEVLQQHPAVRETAVIGVPHPEWGEEPVAFVVIREPAGAQKALEEQLDRMCLDSIARFKRPRRYVFVDELPKNSYGKILKTELRKYQLPAASSETGGR